MMSYNTALSASTPTSNKSEVFLPSFNPFSAIIVKPVVRMAFISKINKTLRFETPVTIPIKKEDGYYTADFKIGTFVIASCEESKEALVKDLKDQFSYAWDYYAKEEDNNLTKGSKVVKEWLRDKIVEDRE